MRKVILVMSGKGGVGKTTVSVNLAYFLSTQGYKTGLLDIDIHGPNVPKMLNIENKKLSYSNDMKLETVKKNENLEVISIGFMVEKDKAVVWRGPLKHKMIYQFVNDVNWNKDIDYLIVDLPPGTGDECLSISQLLDVYGVIIVGTPQEVVISDVTRSINFCKKMNLKIIGLIENMSNSVFGSNTIKNIADKYNLPFLGKLSLNKDISISSDTGKPFIVKESSAKKEFEDILSNFKKQIID